MPRKRRDFRDRFREKLTQARADREVREDWLAAIHGDRADLELLAGDSDDAQQAREAVLRDAEVPDGVTHAMLIAACRRALGSM